MSPVAVQSPFVVRHAFKKDLVRGLFARSVKFLDGLARVGRL
jgi:hypothetical protein